MNLHTKKNLIRIKELVETNKIKFDKACAELGLPITTYKRYWRHIEAGVDINDISYKTAIKVPKTTSRKNEQRENPLNFFQEPESSNYEAYEISVDSEKPELPKPEEKQMTCIVLKGTNSEIQKTLKGLL